MSKKKFVLIGIVIILLVIIFYAYFFVLSPTFVEKPNIEKTSLSPQSEINSENVNWVMNEAGSYKLHSSLSGEPPVIETIVTNMNKVFSTIIINNIPSTAEGPADNPDIRFKMNGQDFLALYSSTDFVTTAKQMSDQGKIDVEVLKDEATLAAKGYKSLYDSFQ